MWTAPCSPIRDMRFDGYNTLNGQLCLDGHKHILSATRLDLSADEIMAFGDSSNDLKMMKGVGIGVAMANAREDVKEAADYITASNDEDGVAHFIEECVL